MFRSRLCWKLMGITAIQNFIGQKYLSMLIPLNVQSNRFRKMTNKLYPHNIQNFTLKIVIWVILNFKGEKRRCLKSQVGQDRSTYARLTANFSLSLSNIHFQWKFKIINCDCETLVPVSTSGIIFSFKFWIIVSKFFVLTKIKLEI